MVVTHHAYNLTVRNGVKDGVCSIEHAYKEVAASHPIDEDSAEHLAGVPKKKRLFSQERATTKKISLNADDTGATFTIGARMPPK